MKTQIKIVLVNLLICGVLSLLQTIGGAVAYIIAPIIIIIGIVCLFQKKIPAAQGYLLSGGLYWLIGYTLCTHFPLVIH